MKGKKLMVLIFIGKMYLACCEPVNGILSLHISVCWSQRRTCCFCKKEINYQKRK